MPSENPGGDRNWYKVATVILSIVAVAISFTSGIYYKRVDQRAARIDEIDKKIESFQVQRERLRAVPRIEVKLLTLAGTGFPESVFKELREFPSVVRIGHAGGGTVKDATVLVTSTAVIGRIVSSPSVESYRTNLSEDRRSVTVDVPLLRPGSLIDLTLMAEDLPTLAVTTRVAEGVVLDEVSESNEANESRLLQPLGVEAIDPADYTTEEGIERALAQLRFIRNIERTRPLLLGEFGSFIAGSLALAFGWLAIFIGWLYHVGRRARARGNRIGRAKRDNALKIGSTKEEVRAALGTPDSAAAITEGEKTFELWRFEPPANLFFGWQPDAFVKFSGESVVSLEYKEYGEKSYG